MSAAISATHHARAEPTCNLDGHVALVDKAGGRVLQTDSSLPTKPQGAGAPSWQNFVNRVTATPLYFDLQIEA